MKPQLIQEIYRLVPLAQNLAMYGATHFGHLIESVNEGWTGSVPVEGPQLDYSFGFRGDPHLRSSSSTGIGSVYDTPYFVATYWRYFSFLTGKGKGCAAALDIADRQNAHSMTIVVSDVVELF